VHENAVYPFIPALHGTHRFANSRDHTLRYAIVTWLIVTIVLMAILPQAQAQGKVWFTTRSPGVLDAPVSLLSGEGPGPEYSAGLWLVNSDRILTPIPSSFTTFRRVPTGGNPLLAYYVVSPGEVVVPGVWLGPATFRMRAWKSSAGSWENASMLERGESENVTIPYLRTGLEPTPVLDLKQACLNRSPVQTEFFRSFCRKLLEDLLFDLFRSLSWPNGPRTTTKFRENGFFCSLVIDAPPKNLP
jgi:hypothetical protein